MISLTELREKAFKLPSPLARERLKVMTLSMIKTAWRILRLRREARLQGKKLHFVFHLNWLGDVIAGEPVVRSLASKDRLLVWVISKPYAELLQHIPWLDAVLPITCSTEWLLLRTFFRSLSVTTLCPDGVPCGWFLFSVRNPNAFGITYQNYYDHGSLLKIFSACGIGKLLDERPRMYPDPNLSLQTIFAILKLEPNTRYIVLHCVSSERLRDWPAECFSVVVEWILRKTSLTVIELGIDPVLKPNPRVIQPRGIFSLSHQAGIIAGACMFVGVDSGFAHVANAYAIPAVIVMGKYKQWSAYMPYSGPWAQGHGCIIVRTDRALENLAPEKVIVAIKKMLERLRDNVIT